MTSAGPSAPKRRSRRGDWRSAELVALDFETTGLDLDRDEVISFGLIPILGGRIDLSGQLYQEVAPAVEPSRSSIPIHHLRAQDLATAPAMQEVADAFRGALSGRFILAWAAEVEIAFLRKVFGGGRRAWRRRTIDVRTLIMAVERPSSDARRWARLLRALRRSNQVRGAGRTDAPCARRRLHDGGALPGCRQRPGSPRARLDPRSPPDHGSGIGRVLRSIGGVGRTGA